ncbi:MAG: TIGR00730 family Rossman fold protein [Prolixibacteraceae bacterium]|jgi:cytokinin riboside 5'-monophosphate phosphoribohydrolase|nr:TIGR00730 family Rossman fold protein [Prolixibacteraceae bacterium]MBT6004832.1 TIGR00730 family Rossman fold protein [Prolixibacteraceae bacterium]MBT6766172.1 TIGR00730 family Rossman fold protein [Prolixibacteraceae bacterium]MBT6999492.1 TIGR00730 family Rossman fold protein [Prolixibacteraceae bacterium]MBT7395882.1 TIGR00730 family Rossman fold protein [Prolixibacteraceae bacterium]
MNICVFSSSSNAIPDVYFQEARFLGQLIGKGNHTLVNGGANVGLMEAVTIATRNAGSKTIGIIPEKMIGRSLASENAHEVLITKDMQERKARMREISDVFIALPGGFGTLEEILEVMTLRQLSYHTKPVIFINTNNFFKYLLKQFEVTYNEMFAKEIYRDLYFVAENSEDAIKYLNDYVPIELDTKWFKVPDK